MAENKQQSSPQPSTPTNDEDKNGKTIEEAIDKMAEETAENQEAAQESQEASEKNQESTEDEAQATEKTEPTDAEKLAAAEQEIAKLKDQLLRQMAEFDNYRKRTMREKSDLILSGGQRVLESLLPVLDDLERAKDSMAKATDVDTLREGVDLIIDKLGKTLAGHGLKKMETDGAAFDTDFHEAIAITPAQDEAQKNHIIDCVQSGYMLGDKVLRHAKVVVGK